MDRLEIDVRALVAEQLAGTAPPAGAEALLGLEFLSWGDGESVWALEAQERHGNPTGIVHGGVICSLADSAMATAFASTLEQGETFTTLELKTSFLRPVRAGRIVATARVVHRGRTTGVLECVVADEEGRDVARSASTVLVLRLSE